MSNNIKSIIREHHYPPSVIDALFVDDQDHNGVWFLYQDILDHIKQLKKKDK